MQANARGELVIVLDCLDLDLVADFWALALDYQRAGRIYEPYLSLLPKSGQGAELLLQRVPEGKADKNRLHLDLRTRDLQAEVERLRGAGATRRSMRAAGCGASLQTRKATSSACFNPPARTGTASARWR